MKRLNNLLVALPALLAVGCVGQQSCEDPNILLILVDDMGYSDLGCFGSEIPTPNIDRLASEGIRYTQFYTTGRSCPTRASIMTGLYQHQAGIGGMAEDPYNHKKYKSQPHDLKEIGYRGALNKECVTLAEVLRDEGYNTYMVGKWHLGLEGMEKWPLQRGFDRYYGILSGASSYLCPQGDRGLTLDNSELPPPQQPYYTTDAFTDHAINFMKSGQQSGQPFFMYMAYNAPHWPLQAKDEDIERFIGKYDAGWEATREARYERMKSMGIIDKDWELAEWESRSWSELTETERRHSALRMSVYAAQVYSLDYNVGRVLDYLEQIGERDNTLIIFMSDNGACAEPYSETGSTTIADINRANSWIFPSYGLPWAQVSNTPLRKYKTRAYEGGISTSFIMSWPNNFSEYNGQIRRNVGFLPDIMATFVDASGATYPTTYDGHTIQPMEGESILPTVANPELVIHDYIFGEHFQNNYARNGRWKIVKDQTSDQWELYDVEADRSERNNLAERYPERVEQMEAKWYEWAEPRRVFPQQTEAYSK